MSAIPPLNGTKTHPLSAHARDILRRMSDHGAIDAYKINPGVINRLRREELIEERNGGVYGYRLAYAITDAGRAVLKEPPR